MSEGIKPRKAKPMRKIISLCGAAILGTSLLGAGCTTAPPVQQTFSVPSPAAPTAWVKNAKITAISVPNTNEAQLLDLNMWRFDFAAPKPVHEIKLIVETQEIGKPIHEIVSQIVQPQIGWPLDKHLSVFVGQAPLYDGQGMKTKANYQIRIGSFRYAPLSQRGESSASVVADNPLAGMSMAFAGTPQRRPDGSFVLMSGDKSQSPSANTSPDVAVVFRVEEHTY